MTDGLTIDRAITYGLSPEQTNALIGTSNVFVRACPGSGKTRSVAARVAWMNEEGKSLALLSFTKVGAEEISRATNENHGISISGTSFVGTVQSFLQKYVLTPFAHLMTQAEVGVRIDPEQVEALDPVGLRSSDYKFSKDSSVVPGIGVDEPSANLVEEIIKAKLSAAKQGFVGLEDDVYWSYRVLNAYPDIRAAVAMRFCEIIVDEAQDLDELQIECLRLLKSTGLESLVLVGDYDQTIYQWRGSRPSLCEEFANDVGLVPLPLTENYRSSQVICNTASAFRNAPVPDKAVGEFATCTISPLLVFYNPGEESLLPDKLSGLVRAAGISTESQAVLVRNGTVKQKITGVKLPTVRGTVKTLLSIKQSSFGPSLSDFKEIERLLLRRAFGVSSMASGLDWQVVRSAAMAVLDNLPALDGSLLDWARNADAALDAGVRLISPAAGLGARNTSFPQSWAQVVVTEPALRAGVDIRVDTVHAFKGESIDAVMLVAGVPSPAQTRKGYGDSLSWSGHLGDPSAEQTEEVRVAYVAITRARQLMVLALPAETPPIVVNKFLSAGFVQEGSPTGFPVGSP